MELPREDHKNGMHGKLAKAMYGARNSAQNWELGYTEMVMEVEFKQGAYSTCLFYHKERNIRAVVRGDDFAVLGRSEDLD